MKKLMVIALGMLSNGEITIAMEVLRRIKNEESDIYFVLHEKMSRQVIDNGFQVVLINGNSQHENRNIFKNSVDDIKPDLILCADVFTMDFSATWSGIDLAELKSTGIPVGTFDEYEWISTQFIQDFAGVPMRIKGELITQSDFFIRPCPVNKPVCSNTKNMINCSLFDIDELLNTYIIDKKNENMWREKLNIPQNSKVIMIVNSTWEYVEVRRSYESARLIDWVPKIIMNYLMELDYPITILHVGGKRWSFIGHDLIDYRHFNNVSPSEYNRMINCSDLFCGTNMISVTLSRAALCGVPVVLFQNEKYLDFNSLNEVVSKMPDWYQQMAKDVKKVLPFKVFPWGWYRFLEPVMTANQYGEIFDKAPIFQPKKCVDILRKNLFDEEHKEKLSIKRNEYIAMLRTLESPLKIWDLI